MHTHVVSVLVYYMIHYTLNIYTHVVSFLTRYMIHCTSFHPMLWYLYYVYSMQNKWWSFLKNLTSRHEDRITSFHPMLWYLHYVQSILHFLSSSRNFIICFALSDFFSSIQCYYTIQRNSLINKCYNAYNNFLVKLIFEVRYMMSIFTKYS